MTDSRSRPGKALAGCLRQYSNEMLMAIHWPLVSSAVFAGGVECNPSGMGRGRSENAQLRSGSSRRCRGLKKDAARMAPESNAAITRRVRGQGRPCPDAPK